MRYTSQHYSDKTMMTNGLVSQMLFSELYKIMVNKVTFVRFKGGDCPNGFPQIQPCLEADFIWKMTLFLHYRKSSHKYLCFLTTHRLSLHIDCSTRCVIEYFFISYPYMCSSCIGVARGPWLPPNFLHIYSFCALRSSIPNKNTVA